MKPAMALFARAPVAGAVKTRLIGRFSAPEVADLYRAFVRDMWAMLTALPGDSEVFLYTDRPHQGWEALAGSRLREQRGRDLGERMLHCFEDLDAGGFAPLLILGSDSPALPAAFLAGWTEKLADAPALLGPCDDGGYWAIGCRRPHAKMFEGVEWSSPRTLAQTEAALNRCGLAPAWLPLHYDVDTNEDLERLAAEPELPPHTLEWLKNSRNRRA